MKQPRKRTTTGGSAGDTPAGQKRSTRKSADVGSAEADGQSAEPASTMPRNGETMLRSVEEIRVRAYEIFLERGGEPGRELDDWLQAERERGQQGSPREREERSAPPGA